ncbi:alpha-tocopherol transfer protein-like [Ixodes scapularis]|uniref:alpha-tocopherol transfer protein-like n=1 Tax=Ixodes scapularis TaxID=6945 RepID=UPI001C38E18A|nr:alpha-tocopherol transfer protein-like [Ixodes scapularis]
MRGNRLPPELQLIAETELGETDERKIEALEEFNQLLDDEPDLYSRRDDEFLLRFLRVAKYNVDAALKRLKEYYKMRKECPFVFENFLPSSAKLEARSVAMVLPRRDFHGRLVLLLRLGAWNPQIISYIEALQAITLVVEHLTADPVAQTTGVSCIHDYGGFSMDKFIAINFGLLKSSIKLLLDCVPTRSKAIHIVRQSYAFDMGFAMVRPFISKKISERIHFHGVNFDGLYEDMPVDMLPKEYGGLGPDLDIEAYWSGLDRAEECFLQNNRYGFHKKESCRDEIEVTAF